MHHLNKIIDEAVDDCISVASILRKCLVVATQLQNAKLQSWVLGELNGYDSKDDLPAYRIFLVQAVGDFYGPNGSHLLGQPLQASVLKEALRDWALKAYLMLPIATYEALANQNQSSIVRVPWPADLVAGYQTAFLEDKSMVLNRAHQEIPVQSLKGMIDMVRNKLLQFALELQRETGGAEPSPDNPSPAVVEKQVTQIIYGGQTNVYGGSIAGDVIQGKGHTVIKGDFNSLSKSLAEIGIPEKLHSGLNAALVEDGEHGHTSDIGPKTKGWLKSSLAALGKGTAKVVGGVLEASATAAILAYYGVKAVS